MITHRTLNFPGLHIEKYFFRVRILYQTSEGVVSGVKTVAADPLSPVNCDVGPRGSNLFVQHIPEMFDWSGIVGI